MAALLYFSKCNWLYTIGFSACTGYLLQIVIAFLLYTHLFCWSPAIILESELKYFLLLISSSSSHEIHISRRKWLARDLRQSKLNCSEHQWPFHKLLWKYKERWRCSVEGNYNAGNVIVAHFRQCLFNQFLWSLLRIHSHFSDAITSLLVWHYLHF